MEYQVTAGYVTVPTAVEGGSVAHVDIPHGAILPADVPDDHVEALLKRGHIAAAGDVDDEAAEEEPAGPAVDTDGDGVPDGTAAQILEWVAGDPDRAVRAMQAEAERDKPRSGLITDLGKITG